MQNKDDFFIDFHTHLDWYKKEDLQNQLSDFNGLIVAASVDQASYEKNLEIAKGVYRTVGIIPTFGIHPSRVVSTLQESQDLSRFDSLLEESRLIGEIGMDFCWYKDASVEQQEYVLRYFLEHCNKTGKYCVIHTKDAENQIAKILLDYPKARPIIHWYDGPESIYRDFIDRGYDFTFGCETCRSTHIQSLLKITPLERILAETDNPESEPWLGGSDSSISLIKRVYSDIGQILGINKDEIAKLINGNSQRILSGSDVLQNRGKQMNR